MDLMSVIYLVGGLALFIYGMTTMGGGLERAAGAKLEKALEKMTGNVFTALLMGIAVTAVIQSSSATTVMVVGFVNAGIMTLKQSVGVILGANIGTTVTAQILRLDSTGTINGSFIMQIIKPKNFAYLAVLIGILLLMTSKKKRAKNIADIFIGFGILFIGMATMESAVSPLADSPYFAEAFATISNPVLGVIVGAVVTAVIQSSSASVGILQALSTTGAITYAAAIPIILGQNIGTCITAFLSSIGASKNARRTAMVHFYFNLIGSVVFLILIYGANVFIDFSFWSNSVDKVGIANFHTLFNVLATLAFVPFTGWLVRIAEKSVPATEEEIDSLMKLEPRLLATPSVAIEQCRKCIHEMGDAAKQNFVIASEQIFSNNEIDAIDFKNREAFLDRSEVEISKYLVSMTNNIPVGSRRRHAEMMHTLSDFEKIGDYSQNICDQYQIFKDNDGEFSELAIAELKIMYEAVSEVVNLTIEGYKARSISIARSVEPIEEVVDMLKEYLTNSHVDRLNKGQCTVINGISFIELVHNFEKIADHCSNIAIYTIQLCEGLEGFDTHNSTKNDLKKSPLFDEQLNFYSKKYLEPLGIK